MSKEFKELIEKTTTELDDLTKKESAIKENFMRFAKDKVFIIKGAVFEHSLSCTGTEYFGRECKIHHIIISDGWKGAFMQATLYIKNKRTKKFDIYHNFFENIDILELKTD